MTTVTMAAPTGTTGTVTTRFGNEYEIDANGLIQGVDPQDALDLLGAGFTSVPPIPAGVMLPLSNGRNSDMSLLGTAAASGKFGLICTAGTTLYAKSEIANNSTITDVALWEMALPTSYTAGADLVVTPEAVLVIGSGTATTKTLDLNAYAIAADGTMSSDLCTTAAQVVPTTADGLPFDINGGNLVPGDRLLLKFTGVIVETASSAVHMGIQSINIV